MKRTVLIALLGVTLTACAGSLFKNKAAPPTMYMLGATRSTPAAHPSSNDILGDLAVLRPRVRTGLDTERIAALYPDRHMDYYADVRWTGPLDEVLQDLAVQELRVNPALHNVGADASVFASTYWLEIVVADFQAAGLSATTDVRVLGKPIGSAPSFRYLGSFGLRVLLR